MGRPRNTRGRILMTSKLRFALAVAVAGCYQTDSTIGPVAAPNSRAMAKVLLTDAPFPFDSIESAKVYVVRVAVSTHADTGSSADSMQWVTVAEPHRQIDLLTLQQGVTDSLGGGELTADQYKAVLVTLNVDSSEGIRFKNGSQAAVHWNGAGTQSYGSFVEAPITVPDTGAVIVIDFDVARSFPYNNRGDDAFDFFATMRAVNRASTGSIGGIVQHDTGAGGTVGPVADATVTAWTGGPNWHALTSGKTDAAGHYRLAFLLPGTYMVSVDPPYGGAALSSIADSNLAVNKGVETTRNFTLSHL
jgi:hypothetical protein